MRFWSWLVTAPCQREVAIRVSVQGRVGGVVHNRTCSLQSPGGEQALRGRQVAADDLLGGSKNLLQSDPVLGGSSSLQHGDGGGEDGLDGSVEVDHHRQEVSDSCFTKVCNLKKYFFIKKMNCPSIILHLSLSHQQECTMLLTTFYMVTKIGRVEEQWEIWIFKAHCSLLAAIKTKTCSFKPVWRITDILRVVKIDSLS